ncbi:YjeF-related protein [Caldalkalibacillus thermarum TA2.A1]|uniref:Bifunctional NAD(P)H-hydrate repair enzyme n=1 Tax=Caldalkalibacillus thermarum (strain TA2.A1) TaxID=986075 RepID=F5L3V1_CALTT|nr:NAD(P)H-hydrate dehydratase [Caldalkalibacillus thermarum]EGL83977.1 YjeF-related protein [Caldalkalibacillus thermarum TA2.A1]QZT34647.1 NAD(P)H-hydrate dehydratase [Caldalkalibacillus thermarum TA2.A1]
MYVLGQDDMRKMDRYTIEQLGLPGVVLMENAGARVTEEIVRLVAEKGDNGTRYPIMILAGHGHNGGDGFVVARRLSDLGYKVKLCLLAAPEKLAGDAKVHYDVYRRRNLPFWSVQDASLEELFILLEPAPVIVDAMLGTGIKGEVRSPYREVIGWLNRHRKDKTVVAVDLPSGLCAETGKVQGEAVRATHTITFVCPKKGFFLQDGPQYIGEWKAVDISVPPSLAETLHLNVPLLITDDDVHEALPRRKSHGHKGSFGHALVIGGSSAYIGAPLFAAQAALNSGAGLVTLAVPDIIYPQLAAQSPATIFLPLPTENGYLAQDALQVLENKLETYDTLVVGPGLGRWPGGGEWLARLLKLAHMPVVVDADGLAMLKSHLSLLPKRDRPVILTPHPGEMARLLGATVGEVESDRLGIAQRFAQEHGVHLVLKGHRTVLATPEGKVWINPLGHDALAKGGSGDILSGIIAAFVAQGAAPEQAVIASVYIHALAAERCAAEKSRYSVLPTDVLEALGPAILSIVDPARSGQ